MLATYQWSLLWDYRSDFFHGLWVAIEVAIVAMILSVIMGIILAARPDEQGAGLLARAWPTSTSSAACRPSSA